MSDLIDTIKKLLAVGFGAIVLCLILSSLVQEDSSPKTTAHTQIKSNPSNSFEAPPTFPSLETYSFETPPTIDVSAVEFPVVDIFTSDTAHIEFIAYPDTVRRNETAFVKIKGEPYTEYSITVYYSSGPSEASGLYKKTSDKEGYVTWNWRIGGRTSAGTYEIKVEGGGVDESVFFHVDVD